MSLTDYDPTTTAPTSGSILADLDNIELLADHVGIANDSYTQWAQNQKGSVEYSRQVMGLHKKDVENAKTAGNDLRARVLAAETEVMQAITNVEQQKATLLAAKSSAPVDDSVEDVQTMNTEISQCDTILAALRQKKTDLESLVTRTGRPNYSAEGGIDSFLIDCDRATSIFSNVLANLDQIDVLDMGYAYIGLRLGILQSTITKYVAAMRAGEANAANDFSVILTLVPAPVTVGVNESLDVATRRLWDDPTMAAIRERFGNDYDAFARAVATQTERGNHAGKLGDRQILLPDWFDSPEGRQQAETLVTIAREAERNAPAPEDLIEKGVLVLETPYVVPEGMKPGVWTSQGNDGVYYNQPGDGYAGIGEDFTQAYSYHDKGYYSPESTAFLNESKMNYLTMNPGRNQIDYATEATRLFEENRMDFPIELRNDITRFLAEDTLAGTSIRRTVYSYFYYWYTP